MTKRQFLRYCLLVAVVNLLAAILLGAAAAVFATVVVYR